jgi:hypothetical protein
MQIEYWNMEIDSLQYTNPKTLQWVKEPKPEMNANTFPWSFQS